MRTIGGGMGHSGFTRQELRDIFNLDPDRPEDRSAIAALQASSTRHLDARRTAEAQCDVATRHQVAGVEPQPKRSQSSLRDPCA
jgi:hypothetical protein